MNTKVGSSVILNGWKLVNIENPIILRTCESGNSEKKNEDVFFSGNTEGPTIQILFVNLEMLYSL